MRWRGGAPWEPKASRCRLRPAPKDEDRALHLVGGVATARSPTCRDLCVPEASNVELTDPAGYVSGGPPIMPAATACCIPSGGTAPRTCRSCGRAGFRTYRLCSTSRDPSRGDGPRIRASLDALARRSRARSEKVAASRVGSIRGAHFARRRCDASRGWRVLRAGRAVDHARLNPYHASPAAIEAPAVLDRGH